MPTALIADDEPHLADYLRGKLAALWPELTIVAVAANGPQAADAIRAHAPDIAFLDIRMPGATGLEVAEQLRSTARRPGWCSSPRSISTRCRPSRPMPSTTCSSRSTMNGWRAPSKSCAPPRQRRLPAPPLDGLLAQLAQHLQGATRNHLRWIRASKKSGDGEITEQISVADVVYIQADDKYTCVYARDGKELREWLIRVPLSDLAAQLDPADFAQIHRSVIVNLHAVAGTRRDITGKLFVRMRDHARELPVARQYVHLFRQM
jgi:DNA-binding LytR/AlgR family response regulator